MEVILAVLAAVAGAWLAGPVFGGVARVGGVIASQRRMMAARETATKGQIEAARRELERQRARIGMLGGKTDD